MKKLTLLLLLGLTACSHNPPKFHTNIEDQVMACYSYSQIAYDSVINNHVGLPVETVVPYLKDDPRGPFYMNIVFGAYAWSGTAHDYSSKVFADCFAGVN